MQYAQILADTGLSANWVMAVLLGIAIFMQKRINDKSDKREVKVDSILEKLTDTITEHGKILERHDEKLKNGKR